VSDQILSRIAKKLEPGVKSDDELTAAVEGVTFQQLLESHGDFRATEATKTAVSNYEKKHNIKDGKPVETKKEPDDEGAGKQDPDMPAWAKALVESNKALADKVAAMEGGQVATKRRQQLDKMISGLPEALRKAYGHVALDKMEDDEFATLLQEVETEAKDALQENKEKGAVFGKPKGQGGITGGANAGGQQKQASKEEIADVMKHIPVM
jgi:hypothetical protein